uniref:Signal peptide protein n=1 Tax=Elaeophora elaphi TaxID=1147741 RepID=A0A0R3S0I8_9BILA
MIAVYFALTYRSYVPRTRSRKTLPEAVSKKRQEKSATTELQQKPVPEKDLKLLADRGGALQPVSEKKNAQPVPSAGAEPREPLPANDQQPVSSPFANDNAEDQAKQKH